MNIYGQLVRAQLEQWSADPTPATNSRLGYNTTTGRVQVDNGSTIENVLTDKWPLPLLPQNHLYNSDFRLWQRGTSVTITSAANPTSTPTYAYQSDRWYANNVLGGGTTQAIVTYSQQPGTFGTYAAQLKITTAPTGTNIQVRGCELYQALETLDSQLLYLKTASFSILVKALGNVTTVGLQFCYATTQIKPTNFIGSEVIVSVNNSTYTVANTGGVPLGFAQTLAGVIGVRVRLVGVSTGNTYDLNNGFQVELASLNVGNLATSTTWQRRHESFAAEFQACQRYYEKSYDMDIAPGAAATSNGYREFVAAATLTGIHTDISFRVPKMSLSGTGAMYSQTTGTINKARDITAAADVTGGVATNGLNAQYASVAATDTHQYQFHWTFDNEI